MAWKTVERYNLGYNIQLKQFYLYYELEGENTAHQIFPSPEEFLALSDMFRNEGPISFNTDGQYFVTRPRPVGDRDERVTVMNWPSGNDELQGNLPSKSRAD